ncbi:hypothetical protein [Microvirga alba]|uniref:Uncharacterized protein n=1 Tax=Microvirga alba TaxID=2791025 RepID=A0A931BPK6_9HYPH|nr:hypothetical protein [Microvirga alba]MBF9234641.1 hypothetical protein [Microvirga alba]
MDLAALIEKLSADPVATYKSTLTTFHLVGLVLGLGAATLLDLIIVRFLIKNKVTNEYCHVIEFSSKVVTIGLTILWLTGLGFLIHYALFDPIKLTNEKVWAKIAIVGVLTLNGMFIHRTVLPFVRSRIGNALFDGLLPRQRSVLFASGAISATSWYVPLVLGSLPQLNFSPALPILVAYGLLLTVAIAATHGLARVVLPRFSTVTIPLDEYETLVNQASTVPMPSFVTFPPFGNDGTLIADFRRRA